MVRTEFRGDYSRNDKLLRLQDRRCENPVLRFFVSDQAVRERKKGGNLWWMPGNGVVREGWSNYRKQF